MEYIMEIANNQYSPFEEKIDKDGFIPLNMLF